MRKIILFILIFLTYSNAKERNFYAQVNASYIKVYKEDNSNSKVISNYFKNDILEINFCNKYNWCQLKNKNFVRSYLIIKIQNNENIKIAKDLKEENEELNSFFNSLKILSKKLNLKKNLSKKEKFLLAYKTALVAYKNKDYDSSYNLFNKLSKNNETNINISFFLARSAYEIKKYTTALSYYERVLFEKPDAHRTKYEMAKTFFAINDFSNAKVLFKELLTIKKLKKNIKINIKNYLLSIENKTKKHYLSGAFIFGLGHDSNINNASEEEVFKNVFIPELNLSSDLKNTTVNDSDNYMELALALNHLYKINSTYSFYNPFLVYTKTMKEYNDKNTTYLSYQPKIEQIYSKRTKLSLGLLFDNLRLDKQNYLFNYALNPNINYIYSNDIALRASLKIQQRKYQEKENQEKNLKYYEILLAYKKVLNTQNIIDFEVLTSKERKDKGTLTLDNNNYQGKVSNLYLFSQKINLNPQLTYKINKYVDFNKNYKTKENTKKLRFDFNLNYLRNERLIYKLSSFYEDSNSNIPSSQYDKYGLSLSLIRTF